MKKFIISIFCFFILHLNVKAISASSYVVMDMDTNRVLMGSNIHNERLIASITKIMTCIIAIENGDLEEVITVDESILKATGSSLYLDVGEKITLKDLLYGMMLRSGNDASTAIALNIENSMQDFSQLMNNYAKKIGMQNTIFYNSHGLEEKDGSGNKSSAYDMALLTSYAMRNKIFREIFSTKNYTAKSDKKTYSWQNKNKLLRYDYITGGKTGYTQKAHRTLVTTAKIDNMNIVIVTLNDGNDWQDHLDLYASIKNNYQNVKLLDKDKFSVVDDIIYIEDQLYIKNDISLTIKNTDLKKLKIKYILLNNKHYTNNKEVCRANVYLNEELLKSEPIYIKIKKENLSKKINRFWQKIFK